MYKLFAHLMSIFQALGSFFFLALNFFFNVVYAQLDIIVTLRFLIGVSFEFISISSRSLCACVHRSWHWFPLEEVWIRI